jgi:hypothetical protein
MGDGVSDLIKINRMNIIRIIRYAGWRVRLYALPVPVPLGSVQLYTAVYGNTNSKQCYTTGSTVLRGLSTVRRCAAASWPTTTTTTRGAAGVPFLRTAR